MVNYGGVGLTHSEEEQRAEQVTESNFTIGEPSTAVVGMRFALPSRNICKSGGALAIYIVLEVEDSLILLMAYQKNEKDELSAGDRKALKSIVDELKG